MIKTLITGTGLFTPPFSVSNDELVSAYNQYAEYFNYENGASIEVGQVARKQLSSSEFIKASTGIESRFVVSREGLLNPDIMVPLLPGLSDDQPSVLAEMAMEAAKEALLNAGIKGEELDLIIVAASNNQRAYPSVSIELQALLGAKGYGFDMNVAGSSATFAIKVAKDAISSGSASRALVVSPEICTAQVNFRDRESHFIFGDACTAMVLEADSLLGDRSGFEVVDTKQHTEFSNNIRNNFGFLNRCSPDTLYSKDKLFHQDGRQVFEALSPLVADVIKEQLAVASLDVLTLKRFWLHQANKELNQSILEQLLGQPPGEALMPCVLKDYANTCSAGAIIAFYHHQADFKVGELGLLCTFGAGYAIGSVLLKKV